VELPTAVGVHGRGRKMMELDPLRGAEKRVYNKWRWVGGEHEK